MNRRDYGTGSITITQVNEYHIAIDGRDVAIVTFPPDASESQCDHVLQAMAQSYARGSDDAT